MLVVPPYLSPAARSALAQAADLAGVELLSVMNNHSAIAAGYLTQGLYAPDKEKVGKKTEVRQQVSWIAQMEQLEQIAQIA